MAEADYRLLTEATGQRIAAALENVSAMVGPPGEVSEAELTAKLADKADVIVDTASGAIASFPDGAAVPAKDVTIGIEPVQDLHGYDRPWGAGGGVNIYDGATNPIEQGGMHLATGINAPASNRVRTSGFIDVEPGSVYTVSAQGADRMAYVLYDDTGVFILSNHWNAFPCTFSTTETTAKVRLSFRYSNDSDISPSDVSNIRLVHGPYSNICPISGWTGANVIVSPTQDAQDGTTYSMSWQTQAGTVYGGTLDVTAGVLTVTHGYIASYNGESLPGKWISSMDVYSAGGTPTTGAQVVYELATPQTYQLTPTEVTLLLGENNVWADTGDFTVTYRADTKLYIQKINAPTDDDMIADAQIASGKYFIIGGNLYRSTTTIPAGDAINPGSNCILTNLADALNALNT